VSKKLPGIRFVPVEFEIGRKTAAKGAKALQQFPTPGLPRNAKPAGIGYMQLNLIAFLQLKRFDHACGKADSETVSPFADLHAASP
jgi:hypothetical protein